MDSEPWDGGGGESGRVGLRAVRVEHKVGEEKEVAFGGRGFGAGGAKHQPPGVDGGGGAGRHLRGWLHSLGLNQPPVVTFEIKILTEKWKR